MQHVARSTRSGHSITTYAATRSYAPNVIRSRTFSRGTHASRPRPLASQNGKCALLYLGFVSALGGPAALMGPPNPQEHGKTDQGAETKKAGRRACFPAFFYSVVFELTCVRYSLHWGLLFAVSCCYNNPCVMRLRSYHLRKQFHTPLKKSARQSRFFLLLLLRSFLRLSAL